ARQAARRTHSGNRLQRGRRRNLSAIRRGDRRERLCRGDADRLRLWLRVGYHSISGRALFWAAVVRRNLQLSLHHRAARGRARAFVDGRGVRPQGFLPVGATVLRRGHGGRGNGVAAARLLSGFFEKPMNRTYRTHRTYRSYESYKSYFTGEQTMTWIRTIR